MRPFHFFSVKQTLTDFSDSKMSSIVIIAEAQEGVDSFLDLGVAEENVGVAQAVNSPEMAHGEDAEAMDVEAMEEGVVVAANAAVNDVVARIVPTENAACQTLKFFSKETGTQTHGYILGSF